MNMISTQALQGTISALSLRTQPGIDWSEIIAEDRPTVVWHIDSTTGRSVGKWMMLPKRTVVL